jgi:transcriptional regulator with XRE-family HTH domain
MTQEIVAQKIGTSQHAYSKIENGSSKISDETLDKIARLFGVSIEDLKSPEPVIINFNNSPQSSSYNKGEIIYASEQLLTQLTQQLKEKDKQIEMLLNQLSEQLIQLKILIGKN